MSKRAVIIIGNADDFDRTTANKIDKLIIQIY